MIVNDASLPKITISSYYSGLLEEDTSEETKAYISTKLNQAVWMQECIEQRARTLTDVTRTLVELQKPFFEGGIGHKKPLLPEEVAAVLNIPASTVSRAVREKYLQCPWGIFPMSYFFSRLAGDGTPKEDTP